MDLREVDTSDKTMCIVLFATARFIFFFWICDMPRYQSRQVFVLNLHLSYEASMQTQEKTAPSLLDVRCMHSDIYKQVTQLNELTVQLVVMYLATKSLTNRGGPNKKQHST